MKLRFRVSRRKLSRNGVMGSLGGLVMGSRLLARNAIVTASAFLGSNPPKLAKPELSQHIGLLAPSRITSGLPVTRELHAALP